MFDVSHAGGAPGKGALQGSLYAPADAQLGQWRRFLLTRSAQDAALFLRKWLREALRRAGGQARMRFKAGARARLCCPPQRGHAELGTSILKI
jgi:hypothetical protein